MFKALAMIEQDDAIATAIAELEESDLPEGDVLIDVAYSSLNYKDGLVLNNLGGLVKPTRTSPASTSPAPSPTATTRISNPATRSSALAGASAKSTGAATRKKPASRASGWSNCPPTSRPALPWAWAPPA